MKSKKLLIAACLSFGVGLGLNAQVIVNSSAPDTQLGGTVDHTGLAISPGTVDVQAAVYSDGTGDYYIDWMEGSSGTILDHDKQAGNDPDVAYYVDENAVVVVYVNGGDVWIDEYYLTSTSPVDYTLVNTLNLGSGQYPNIDIASTEYGIITWENAGDIFVTPYLVGSGFGPIVHVGSGVQPDAIVTDNYALAALTYIDAGGDLVIETIDYFNLFSGNYLIVSNWTYSPIQIYEFPRIASNKNAQYGNLENFSVVVQDYNTTPGSATVDGFFVTNASTMNGPVLVNPDFANCYGDYPLPVVVYQQGRVRVAWSQTHLGGCSGLTQTLSGGLDDDVFVRMFSANGATSGNYLEANGWQSGAYSSYSRTSIASRYDGTNSGSVNNSNYQGGILFSDQGDLFWKAVYPANPSYIEEQNIITEDHRNNFSLVTSPVDQTIEVLSKSDNFASFEMLDNAGRLVELKTISSSDNVYSIDISHLSGGMYFLKCSSETGNEILRVLQVTK